MIGVDGYWSMRISVDVLCRCRVSRFQSLWSLFVWLSHTKWHTFLDFTWNTKYSETIHQHFHRYCKAVLKPLETKRYHIYIKSSWQFDAVCRFECGSSRQGQRWHAHGFCLHVSFRINLVMSLIELIWFYQPYFSLFWRTLFQFEMITAITQRSLWFCFNQMLVVWFAWRTCLLLKKIKHRLFYAAERCVIQYLCALCKLSIVLLWKR